MLEDFPLREPHLQLDLAARLLEQAIAVGGGGGGDALFFGRDLRGAALAQRLELAGQRLQLLLDGGQLCGGGGLQLCGLDQVLADGRAAAGQVVFERLVEEVIENADEDDEVGDRPAHRQDHVGDAVRRRVLGLGGVLLPAFAAGGRYGEVSP